MLGGGLLSAANVFYNGLVVIRAQHTVLIGYITAIVIATLVATPLVEAQGVMGACIAYSIACAALFVSFAVILVVSALAKKKR